MYSIVFYTNISASAKAYQCEILGYSTPTTSVQGGGGQLRHIRVIELEAKTLPQSFHCQNSQSSWSYQKAYFFYNFNVRIVLKITLIKVIFESQKCQNPAFGMLTGVTWRFTCASSLGVAGWKVWFFFKLWRGGVNLFRPQFSTFSLLPQI